MPPIAPGLNLLVEALAGEFIHWMNSIFRLAQLSYAHHNQHGSTSARSEVVEPLYSARLPTTATIRIVGAPGRTIRCIPAPHPHPRRGCGPSRQNAAMFNFCSLRSCRTSIRFSPADNSNYSNNPDYWIIRIVGAPGRTRTCYPRLRRPMLYPDELQAQSLQTHASVYHLVGVEGFEPPTSCSQSRRATRLRYTPKIPPQSRATRAVR